MNVTNNNDGTFTYKVAPTQAPDIQAGRENSAVQNNVAPEEDDEEWCAKHQHGTYMGRCATCRDEWLAANNARQRNR